MLVNRHNAYAVLIGDGPERAAVEESLDQEIAARRVIFAGRRGDVRPLYPAFDVLVHTTLQEGHPRVVREALAERVPVVSAKVSGTGCMAGDQRLGALVDPGDAPAYLTALTRFWTRQGFAARRSTTTRWRPEGRRRRALPADARALRVGWLGDRGASERLTA